MFVQCLDVSYDMRQGDGGPFSNTVSAILVSLSNQDGKSEDCYSGQHVLAGSRTKTLICEENNAVGYSLKNLGSFSA
jgi:hypothetical protein